MHGRRASGPPFVAAAHTSLFALQHAHRARFARPATAAN